MNKHLRAVLLALGVLICVGTSQPAEANPELEEKYEKKIAKPFVAHGGWVVDYDDALARAEKEKKFIFAYFTRSYSR